MARHLLYRIRDERPFPVTPDPKAHRRIDDLQFATFGPKGSALAFIHRFVLSFAFNFFVSFLWQDFLPNLFILHFLSLSLMQISLLCRENIYYQDSAESVPKLIASSPDETTVMNGIPDWLYEEEILSKESAIWFSPEGTRLLYASFNDSGVDITNYPLYGNYEDNLNTSPELMAVRYPKVRFLPTLSLPFSHQFFPLVHTSYICPKSFRCDFEINSTWICLSN